jgi:hypothetical protein
MLLAKKAPPFEKLLELMPGKAAQRIWKSGPGNCPIHEAPARRLKTVQIKRRLQTSSARKEWICGFHRQIHHCILGLLFADGGEPAGFAFSFSFEKGACFAAVSGLLGAFLAVAMLRRFERRDKPSHRGDRLHPPIAESNDEALGGLTRHLHRLGALNVTNPPLRPFEMADIVPGLELNILHFVLRPGANNLAVAHPGAPHLAFLVPIAWGNMSVRSFEAAESPLWHARSRSRGDRVVRLDYLLRAAAMLRCLPLTSPV